jgi:multicomponent Na+:H+ antiporter subunit E
MNKDPKPSGQLVRRHIRRNLVAHLSITILIPLLYPLYAGVWDYMVTGVVTGLVLGLINRRYGRFLFWTAYFIIYLLWEIIISNLVMARVILDPKPKLDPGIIAVPLSVTSNIEITLLSLAVTVTPGTLIVELAPDPTGRTVLYVHALQVVNPDNFRATIKGGFERMIMNISRGATA